MAVTLQSWDENAHIYYITQPLPFASAKWGEKWKCTHKLV